MRLALVFAVFLVCFASTAQSLFQWKAFSDPVATKKDAFTAGIDSQGNHIYVGCGIWNNTLTPGRLLVEAVGNNDAGLYVEFGGVERKITTNIEYYVNNPVCKYKWIASSNGAVEANAVQVVGTKTYYIGRVYDQDTLIVGKVSPGSKLFYGNNGLGYSITLYEVLVCELSSPIDWKPWNPSEGMKSDALSAGEDSEGNQIYIGHGYFYETSAPGRLLFEATATKPAGLYVEFRNKEHQVVSDIEYYALNPACSYQWVASSSGDIVPNAIEITSVKSSYIGRKFALGSMHVGKVLLGSRMFFGLDGIGYSTNTYEVLVCNALSGG